MSQRHKAIKATLDVGTAVEWNDDHLFDYSDEIDTQHNFIGVPVTNIWDTAQTAGTGVAPVLTFTDHHSIIECDSGAANNDVSSMRHEFNGAAGNITYIDDVPLMTMAVWLETYPVGTECVEFGLMDNANAPFLANQDGAYFRVDTNVLYAVTGDGAAETATDITPALGIPEYGNYKIELTGSNCLFYVDDMETAVATHTTNLPNNDLTMKFSCKNIGGGGGNQVLMYVDAVGLKVNRYKG